VVFFSRGHHELPIETGIQSATPDLSSWIGSHYVIALMASPSSGQTTATGALAGELLDPTGAVILARLSALSTGAQTERRLQYPVTLAEFSFLLLPPGSYELQASRADFETLELFGLEVYVTETLEVEARMRLATQFQNTQVVSGPLMIQTDNSALGRVANESTITGLPLVTRNFAQIAGLSPGVAVGVSNAGELGLGGTALSQIAPPTTESLFMGLALTTIISYLMA